MANIFDVAKYILNTIGEVSTMKLQKLCYYSQAWNLVWENEPIFKEEFEAWANGPVCRELYNLHKGKFIIGKSFLKNNLLSNSLNENEIKVINKVMEKYGVKEGFELSDLTHAEKPWIETRKEIPEGLNCANKIPKKLMKDFYSKIDF